MIKYHRRFLDDAENHRRWIDPRLYSLRVADLQRYLLHKGWKLVPPDRPGFLVFEEPAVDPAGPLYQFVPASESWDAYHALVYDLIAALALIEDRHAGEVLNDICRLRTGETVPANGPDVPRQAQPSTR